MKSVIKALLTRTSPGPYGFTAAFYKTFQVEHIPSKTVNTSLTIPKQQKGKQTFQTLSTRTESPKCQNQTETKQKNKVMDHCP